MCYFFLGGGGSKDVIFHINLCYVGQKTAHLLVFQRFGLSSNASVFGLRVILVQIQFLLGGSYGGLRVVLDSR